MIRSHILCCLLFLWAGCATVPNSADEAALRERPVPPRIHADLVTNMLANGQNYAALAHVEELERGGEADPELLTWLRGAALYNLGQMEASERAYRQLLKTSYRGRAHHGLGLIAAKTDLYAAVLHFNQAVRLLPTDAEIRNDLGYTLMLAGRLVEAQHHLATATELAPESGKAQTNLVLSFLLAGRAAEAQSLGTTFQMSSVQFSQLQEEARLMRQLVLERAEELSAARVVNKESNNETEADKGRHRSIPGLYSRIR